MPDLKTYRIFISHCWTYSDAYEKLCALLDQAANFTYANYSVPKDDPIHDAPSERELYQAIKDQMAPCHVVLIMAGVYSTYSKWINKEIAIAKREFTLPKPIIGVKPWAQTNVSSVVSDNADVLVGWNTDSIVAAIRGYSL